MVSSKFLALGLLVGMATGVWAVGPQYFIKRIEKKTATPAWVLDYRTSSNRVAPTITALPFKENGKRGWLTAGEEDAVLDLEAERIEPRVENKETEFILYGRGVFECKNFEIPMQINGGEGLSLHDQKPSRMVGWGHHVLYESKDGKIFRMFTNPSLGPSNNPVSRELPAGDKILIIDRGSLEVKDATPNLMMNEGKK